jgi:hypothetical protein
MLFEPNYPALRYYCSYCGEETSAEKYLSVRAQDYKNISHEPKFLVFCAKHQGKYQELCGRLETWRNQERAKFEQALAEEAPKMALIIESEVFGTKLPEPPAAKESAPTKRRRAPGEIPNPREMN